MKSGEGKVMAKEEARPGAEEVELAVRNGTAPATNGLAAPSLGDHVPTKDGPGVDPATEEDFRRINRRRRELIDRKVIGVGLTAEEEAELQQLDARADAFVQVHFPSPLVEWDQLETLARKLGHEFQRPEGF